MALVVTQASSGSALANHGGSMWGYGGLPGSTFADPNECYPNQSRIVMYPPSQVWPTYLTTAEYQLVGWTARIWWKKSDGNLDHTAVSWTTSDVGWFYTGARSGDNYGNVVAFVGRGSVSGGVYLPWYDAAGRLQGSEFALVWDLNPSISKVFAVEYIYIWYPNERQPLGGSASVLVPFADDYRSYPLACLLP